MMHEVSTLPPERRFLRKRAQRGRSTEIPLCARILPSPDGNYVCKGAIVDDRCSNCGMWYGDGSDPGF